MKFIKEEIIARHWWRDGSSLDLYSCFEKNLEEIKHFAGNKSALEFEKFDKFYVAEDRHQDYYVVKFLNYLRYKKACGREETISRIWN